jgi:hypothetical protein
METKGDINKEEEWRQKGDINKEEEGRQGETLTKKNGDKGRH